MEGFLKPLCVGSDLFIFAFGSALLTAFLSIVLSIFDFVFVLVRGKAKVTGVFLSKDRNIRIIGFSQKWLFRLVFVPSLLICNVSGFRSVYCHMQTYQQHIDGSCECYSTGMVVSAS